MKTPLVRFYRIRDDATSAVLLKLQLCSDRDFDVPWLYSVDVVIGGFWVGVHFWRRRKK